MSDTPFPDAWQATDGKWYPRASQPRPAATSESVQAPLIPEGDRSANGPSGARRAAPFVAAATMLVVGLAVGAVATYLLAGRSDDAEPSRRIATAATDAGDRRNPIEVESEFEISFGNDEMSSTYSGEVYGLVELTPTFNDAVSCLAVVGEITVEASTTQLDQINLVASLGVDDHAKTGDGYVCDTAPLVADGYVPLERSVVAVGEGFSFYEVFALEEGEDMDHVLLGTYADPGLYVYEAEIIDDAPSARRPPDAPQLDAHSPGDAVEWTDSNGDVFEYVVDGFVEMEVSETAAENTRCFVLVGEVTPVDLQGKEYAGFPGETLVTTGGVSRGTEFGDCDYGDVIEAGYRFEYEVSPAEGESANYFVVAVSAGDEPELAIIGSPFDDNVIAFELRELDQIP